MPYEMLDGESIEDARASDLSRRLVFMHVAGVLLLFVIVAATVIWVSSEHNRLARTAAHKLVGSGVSAFVEGPRSTVRDYSLWTEAYDAALSHDTDWLYNNIGTATDLGTLDLVVIAPGNDQPAYGWVPGSPVDGVQNLIGDDLLEAILGMLDAVAPDDETAPYMFTQHDGALFVFTAARIVPTDGLPENVADAEVPRQIHGLRMSQEVLDAMGARFLISGLRLASTAETNGTGYPLRDNAGQEVARLLWEPPSPGDRILGQIAIPLIIAMILVGLLGGLLSRFAVRSAKRLELALADATAADRAKTEFLANVSHELRTPMNGIVGVAQLLQKSDLSEHQKALVAVLKSSSDTQMNLIRGLLDLTQIESGNRKIEENAFDVDALAREMGDLAAVAAEEKGLAVSIDLPPSPIGTLYGDDQALRQVMNNIIGNAIKFTDEGSIRITVSSEEHPDEVICKFSVIDTGRGIAVEDQTRIFQRFSQVDGSATRQKGGVGLGLAISQSLVRLMGGSISVESTLGSGATFTVALPLKKRPLIAESIRSAA